jgi:hypothetical protein
VYQVRPLRSKYRRITFSCLGCSKIGFLIASIAPTAFIRFGARQIIWFTGDKSGLPALGRHKGTQIVSARDFAALVA